MMYLSTHQYSQDEIMPGKPYKKLLTDGLRDLSNDSNNTVMYNLSDEPILIPELGEIFQIVARMVELRKQSPIAKAFRAAALDPQIPFHWHHLLELFCGVLFSEKKRGAKRKRTPEFFEGLKNDYAAIQKKFGTISTSQVSRRLAKEFPAKYGRLKAASIRRVLT
jgi:hypothetical protein